MASRREARVAHSGRSWRTLATIRPFLFSLTKSKLLFEVRRTPRVAEPLLGRLPENVGDAALVLARPIADIEHALDQ